MNAETQSEAKTGARPKGSGKSLLLWGLVILNLALVVALVHKFMQPAYAQAGRPSDYLMVPGVLQGVPTGVVFIVDTSRGELSAMTYDDTTNIISPMPKISLQQVFNAGGNVGGGPRVKPR